MSAPTPGPWRYDLHRDDDGTTLDLANVDVDAGDDGRPSDYGSTLLEGGYLVRETDAENDANARLIAAAPDLLDALERLLRFTDDLCGDVGVSTHYPSAENARAVIRAARGEDAP